ncbi:oligopeptide ABC transporter permease OppB [Wenzhouxiangella sp. AB-CW3]|uniref:oligopeptide ABC transporter permease OppB n=1 Tax=Wenzhouxiangella sp. AB-CW3 TaxID=2771012 RepID=UPI00168A7089|nr:oligopeptide ABC transporter permease OppB [Wenzhouxiangella sp. AB-CW3]QOC22671.1 oligopeptide ABC transporter permease OppB [Wenzhouxiangella sp. AB-CW3]
MLKYSLRRLASAIPTLFLLITVAFFLIRIAPGGPFDSERALPAEIEANLAAKYHLDEPLIFQYGRYLWQIARLDFGPSFHYRDWTVNDLIIQGAPVSFTLGILALAIALVVGVMVGAWAALRQNRPADYTVMSLAMIGISIPNFVMAPLLILLFAITLGWLPAGGWEYTPTRMLLPVLTLALPMIAYIARITRASMIEVLHSSYIRTVRAKGMPEKEVILRHALKPALLPVISYLGPAAAAIMTGSVVVERIFTIPGIGTYFVQGALNRDYTLVMGVVILYGMLIILFNFVVDLLYAWLDPRIRYDDGEVGT